MEKAVVFILVETATKRPHPPKFWSSKIIIYLKAGLKYQYNDLKPQRQNGISKADAFVFARSPSCFAMLTGFTRVYRCGNLATVDNGKKHQHDNRADTLQPLTLESLQHNF